MEALDLLMFVSMFKLSLNDISNFQCLSIGYRFLPYTISHYKRKLQMRSAEIINFASYRKTHVEK